MFTKIMSILFALLQFSFAQEWNPDNLPNRFGFFIDTTFAVKISSSMPDICIRYREYYKPDSDDAGFVGTHFRVDLKRTYISPPFQIIESSSDAYQGPVHYDYGYQDSGIEGMAIDINFDGYKDLRFKVMTGANTYSVNQFYEHYLYNADLEQFELYDALSEIPNPSPAPEEIKVYSYNRMGFSGSYGIIYLYSWEDKDLHLREQYIYKAIEDSCEAYYWECNDCCMYSVIVVIYKQDTLFSYNTFRSISYKIPLKHLRYW